MLNTAEFIAQSAYDSLIDEVETTPKPGLVDLNNNGSHTDINLELFHKSALAIRPTFLEIALLSLCWKDSLEHLFGAIRTIGIEGERHMFEATGGVNTHKGALFSLGLLVGATGYAMQRQYCLEASALCSLVSRMTKETLQQELELLKYKHPSSHGEKLYFLAGWRGIRGEVMGGFPTIVQHVLPRFPSFATQLCMHDKLIVLLSLMANLEDTNILSRGGEQALCFIQDTARTLLNEEANLSTEAFSEKLLVFDSVCIKDHLSSGGAADLLAVSLYLHRVQNHPVIDSL